MQRPLNMLGRGERKFRPKGTPDAEAIFGSRKVKKVDRPRNSKRDDDQWGIRRVFKALTSLGGAINLIDSIPFVIQGLSGGRTKFYWELTSFMV